MMCHVKLVSCGYSQVTEVDLSKSYSTVKHEITFQVLLLIMIQNRFLVKVVNVETAFQIGD